MNFNQMLLSRPIHRNKPSNTTLNKPQNCCRQIPDEWIKDQTTERSFRGSRRVLYQQLPHKLLCRHPTPSSTETHTQDCDNNEKLRCTVSPTSLCSTRTRLHYDYFEIFCIRCNSVIVNKMPTLSL